MHRVFEIHHHHGADSAGGQQRIMGELMRPPDKA